MTHRAEYEDQIALYSLGLLEGQELRELEEHLTEGCEICAAILRDSDAVFTSLPFCLDDEPLSKDVGKKIFDRLPDRKPLEEKPSIFGFWKNISPVWLSLGTAVSLALIIFLVASNVSLRNELRFREKNLTELQAKMIKDKEIMEFVLRPDVNEVDLGSKMPDMNASGKLLWDKETDKGMFLVSSIPIPKQGKTYQLWAIEDGKPVSMGVFDVDKEGNSMMEIELMPGPAQSMQFAVTLEPAGGMPQPTGDMYLYGSL